jgi:2-keto-4-pentenoate hydratase
LDTKAIESAALLLSTLRQPGNSQARQLVDLPSDCRPASVDDAYQIQARLRSLLAASDRGPVIGWMIGCSTPVMQEYLNIDHPSAGTLFESTLYADAAELVIGDYFRAIVNSGV